MKKILLVVLVGAAAWWYFAGGRTLSEENIAQFYRDHEAATIGRNPDALCAELAEDFVSIGSLTAGGQSHPQNRRKPEICSGYRSQYEAWDKLGEKMGGALQLDSTYKVNSIQIASDRMSAVVDVSSTLDVAGTITNIRSQSKDTLIRKNGKVLLQRSEGTASITAGG